MSGKAVCWVLWHRYSDGSGSHVERVYVSQARAQMDFDLLTKGDCKVSAGEWHLSETQFVGGGP